MAAGLAVAACQPPPAKEAATPAAPSPRAVVEAFQKLAFEDHKPVEATLKYISPDVVEHDVNTPGGRQAILDFMKKRDWTNSRMKATVHRTISEGDLVAVHHHVTEGPDAPGTAFVDIFRVKDGLIVEHWDVAQPVPRNPPNPIGMF